MKCILLLCKPKNVQLSNVEETLCAIIGLRNIILSMNTANTFIIINNKRVIYNSIHESSIENILRGEIQDSDLEYDLSTILLGLNRRRTSTFSNTNNIIQILNPVEVNNDLLLYIVTLGSINLSENLLNLKHIIDTSNINTKLFSSSSNNESGLNLLGKVETSSFKNFIKGLVKNELKNDYTQFSMPIKCTCHDIELQIGFICPVCLTPYCKKIGMCTKCKTRIAL